MLLHLSVELASCGGGLLPCALCAVSAVHPAGVSAGLALGHNSAHYSHLQPHLHRFAMST